MRILRNVPLVRTTHQIRFRHDGRRIDENNVPVFADTPDRWVVNPKRLAVHAVHEKASFPGTTAQFLRVCFNVHRRPCPDRPKVSEMNILAVESLRQRRISQRPVWGLITEVDSRQYQLSPEKFLSLIHI